MRVENDKISLGIFKLIYISNLFVKLSSKNRFHIKYTFTNVPGDVLSLRAREAWAQGLGKRMALKLCWWPYFFFFLGKYKKHFLVSVSIYDFLTTFCIPKDPSIEQYGPECTQIFGGSLNTGIHKSTSKSTSGLINQIS